MLNGVKLWTTNGVVADLLVVMARVPKSDGHRGGITAFVVEGNADGITVEHRNAFMGLRGLENGVTRFHEVRVPADRRIGGRGPGPEDRPHHAEHGPALAARQLRGDREAGAQDRAGVVGRAGAVGPAGRRARGGGQEDRVHRRDGLRARGRRRAVQPAGGRQAQDIRIEAALAKLYCSEMGWQIADELVQIRGGRGYETAASLAARGERGVPAEQLLRDHADQPDLRGLFGDHAAVHRPGGGGRAPRRGRGLIKPGLPAARKRPRGGQGRRSSTADGCPRWSPARGSSRRRTAEFGPLAAHLRYVERASRKLARATFYGMARWQGRLERKQGFLGRIVDIGAELFAMSAVCVRAQMDADDRRPPGAAGPAFELADAFCAQARLRCDELFSQLWDNTDAADAGLARRVLAGRYTWLEDGIIDPSTPGPWVAAAEPGPSKHENVHRHVG